MLTTHFITLLLMFLAYPIQIDQSSPQDLSTELVVWNVGQGLWTTWMDAETCQHFDIGGEFAPWNSISKTCGRRRNIVRFSHWDWDHIGLTVSARRWLSNLCLLTEPRGKGSESKRRYLARISICQLSENSDEIVELHHSPADSRSSNAMSRVYLAANKALMPGDSIASEERLWAPTLKGKKVRLLILGHHGSRTSTSTALLKHLPHLKQAIASARNSRYGHPHKTVVDRLRKKGVAVLKTEDWGTLRWEVPQDHNRISAEGWSKPQASDASPEERQTQISEPQRAAYPRRGYRRQQPVRFNQTDKGDIRD